MSIHDYTELLVEAAERSGQGDLPARGEMLVGMLETYLNKKLRTTDQESSSTVTTSATGTTTLASDLVEIKGVYHDDLPVPRLTYSPVEEDIDGWGYYTDGTTLKSTLKSREIVIRYYAAIPSLHSNSTNWLLSAEPEIYLQGLLWQAHLRAKEYEIASGAKGYMDNLIEEFAVHDRNKRRGLTEIDMTGGRHERGNDFTISPA